MNKKDFVDYLNGIFKKYGYIRKKSKFWVQETDDLIKIIHLQKSQFSNKYYLNFGFVLKNLDIQDTAMHIYNRLGDNTPNHNQRIQELLDMETNIEDGKRKFELEYYIKNNLLSKLSMVNSEQDLLEYLKGKPHLNDVPLVVKKYFHLI